MIASTKAYDLIKERYPFSGIPYTMKGDVYIGYGYRLHRGPVTTNDERISWGLEHADAVLLCNIVIAEQAINDMIVVPINQNQFDYMVSIYYFDEQRAKKIIIAMNTGDYENIRELIDSNELFFKSYPEN